MELKIALNNFSSSLKTKPYSKLFFVGDGSNWVLSWETREVRNIAKELGISTCITKNSGFFRQSVFYASKYILLNPFLYFFGSGIKCNIAFSYFHGYPSSGELTANRCYNNLKKYHHRISRIQVSHSYMRDIVLETGIDPEKIFLIPIAINSDFFSPQTDESKKNARDIFGIPHEAVVVGSFQKDGNGKGKGLEPKLIKGPDIFLNTIRIVRESVPELFVLLSGPARGYVKKGLDDLKIPYKHVYLNNYPDIGQLYHCLDLYIVSSREEGGPKAILESMASGIPLVTTRVGQAMDLVTHKKNALLVDVEDVEALAHCTKSIIFDTQLRKKVIKNGFCTANKNSYNAHIPLWKTFFEGFVNRPLLKKKT